MRSHNDTMEAGCKLKRIFLAAGEIVCPLTPAVVTTVLGSCVSLCLWDPARQQGGINHYVLPYGAGNARYGEAANDLLLQAMLARGSTFRILQAKIFGGAVTLGGIGEQNIAAALETLRRYNIPLMAQRTGGAHGMLLHFRTDTAEVMLRVAGGTRRSRSGRRPAGRG
ncbi:chemotaxis protein CheD [Roseomonas sp. E05]|uniref:chemotaxis protein CheD n=1 Tax=Roseomonas sp. E05 TaxID=3046310 RepID=UPI0024B8D045|nr:chemotaxis protein CheD [Roseomonas sp. E05]MDJ0391614.1 chemotaxis protein CheD [Roseomonas sp. E05]